MTAVAEMPPGFADKVLSAQSTFRAVMDAMAQPGRVLEIAVAAGAPAGLMRGAAAIALTLFDHDTPIWLDGKMSETTSILNWLKFHSGAPVVDDPSVCSFALIGDVTRLPDLARFSCGSSEYPDRSTTLIVQVGGLMTGLSYELRGPGIDGASTLQASAECRRLLEQLAVNATLFPRGIDVVLVSGDSLVAIPRTARLTAAAS